MRERKQPQFKRGPLDRIGAFFDRVAFAFSPELGLKRMARRSEFERASRMAWTDGAEKTEARDGSWLSSRLSPDSGLELELDELRKHSRELYRTDSIGGAVDSRVNLVVSYGFTPQAQIKERPGLATKAQAKQWNDELEEVYERIYPKISKCGRRSIWQLLRLAERHHGFDGESITILSDRGGADKPIPLTLEVVDPERMQTPPKMIGNPRVRLGVEYDESGRIVAYHIRDNHPHDTLAVGESFTRYEAERVIHVFEPWFAGQSRGFPWLTRALNRCKDAKDLDEAAILAAQVEACFAAFVTSSAGGAAREAIAAASGSVDGKRTEDVRPGTIRYLDEGEQVHFASPSRSAGYSPIQEWNYRRAAAGMNYPYEMIAKNWSGLSFAAGRLSLADARLMVKSQQKLLREMWCSEVWCRMVEEAVIVGAVSIPPRLYYRAPWWFQRHEFGDPSWPYALTPGEEIDSAANAVNNNFRTKASVVAEYGGNLEDVFEQRKRERQLERDFDIEPATAEQAERPVAQEQEQLAEAVK